VFDPVAIAPGSVPTRFSTESLDQQVSDIVSLAVTFSGIDLITSTGKTVYSNDLFDQTVRHVY